MQGDYIGFRSAAAEDRFLQARRKGAALSFFNTNLGEPPTAETWITPTEPWID